MQGISNASRSEKADLMATGPHSQLREIGFILIREGALLPPNLAIEREAFLPGWHLVKNLDGYTLNRKIKEANWNFVRLGGDYKARMVGRAYPGVLRGAVKRILTELRGSKFNSLEITVVGLKRFIGLAFLSISAHRRHIQGGLKVSP
jgi:hypothetical protein